MDGELQGMSQRGANKQLISANKRRTANKNGNTAIKITISAIKNIKTTIKIIKAAIKFVKNYPYQLRYYTLKIAQLLIFPNGKLSSCSNFCLNQLKDTNLSKN
ncbi:hypothetical protein CN514_15815 [Bacillus sp. AFS001701]|nr:hypothetical protein CN514_15815 [Bacillus sp. AFS001701]